MCDSHPVPIVFISLRLLLFRYESHIQNQTVPFLFLFFHSEKKDTSLFIQKRKTHHVSFCTGLKRSCASGLYLFRYMKDRKKYALFISRFISTRKESSSMPKFFSLGFAGGKNTTYTPAIPPSKNATYTPAIPPLKNRTSLINKRLPLNDLIFYFCFIF